WSRAAVIEPAVGPVAETTIAAGKAGIETIARTTAPKTNELVMIRAPPSTCGNRSRPELEPAYSGRVLSLCHHFEARSQNPCQQAGRHRGAIIEDQGEVREGLPSYFHSRSALMSCNTTPPKLAA